MNRRNAMIGWLVLTLLRRRARGSGRGIVGAATSFVGGAIVAAGLAWLLRGDYYAAKDRRLSGLATPARVSLIVILAGLARAGILWLWAEAYG